MRGRAASETFQVHLERVNISKQMNLVPCTTVKAINLLTYHINSHKISSIRFVIIIYIYHFLHFFIIEKIIDRNYLFTILNHFCHFNLILYIFHIKIYSCTLLNCITYLSPSSFCCKSKIMKISYKNTCCMFDKQM